MQSHQEWTILRASVKKTSKRPTFNSSFSFRSVWLPCRDLSRSCSRTLLLHPVLVSASGPGGAYLLEVGVPLWGPGAPLGRDTPPRRDTTGSLYHVLRETESFRARRSASGVCPPLLPFRDTTRSEVGGSLLCRVGHWVEVVRSATVERCGRGRTRFRGSVRDLFRLETPHVL